MFPKLCDHLPSSRVDVHLILAQNELTNPNYVIFGRKQHCGNQWIPVGTTLLGTGAPACFRTLVLEPFIKLSRLFCVCWSIRFVRIHFNMWAFLGCLFCRLSPCFWLSTSSSSFTGGFFSVWSVAGPGLNIASCWLLGPFSSTDYILWPLFLFISAVPCLK